MFLLPFQARVVRDPVCTFSLSLSRFSHPFLPCRRLSKAFADLPIADRSRSWSVERILGETRVPPACA